MTRAEREDGFTLVELLVVLMIGGFVLTGLATLMQTAILQGADVVARTEATQRGRLAMDQITRQLRSQVCIDTGAASERASIAAGQGNAVTFYTDFSDGTQQPTRRELIYEPGERRVVEHVYPATSEPGTVPTTFSTSATSRVVLDDVTAPRDGTPFFRFYAYTATGDPRTTTAPLPVPLSPASLADTARIAVAMDVRPARADDDQVYTRLQDSVHLRTADPNTSDPDPDCR